jgi:hydroxyacylglutathione hydrolase
VKKTTETLKSKASTWTVEEYNMNSIKGVLMEQKQSVKLSSQTPNPIRPGVFDVSPEEVHQLRGQVCIVDVRRPDEWTGEFGHIEEARHIILDLLPQQISELNPEDTIVFVCRSGQRSGQATEFAQQNGFKSVFNMKGGMIAWTEKNFSVTEKNGA